MAHTREIFGTDGALLVDRSRVARSAEAAHFAQALEALLGDVHLARALGMRAYRLAGRGPCSVGHRNAQLASVYDAAWRGRGAGPILFDGSFHADGLALRTMSGSQLRAEERRFRRQIRLREVNVYF